MERNVTPRKVTSAEATGGAAKHSIPQVGQLPKQRRRLTD